MLRPAVAAFAAALTLLVPAASAGISLDEKLVKVEVDDSYADHCLVQALGVCEFSGTADPTNPANSNLDAYDRFYFAGVATNPGAVGLGSSSLDQEYYVDGSSLWLPDPVIPLLTATYNGSLDGGSALPVGVRMSESNVTLLYDLVTTDGSLDPSWVAFPYAHGSGLQYDRLGPWNVAEGNDTRSYEEQARDPPCRYTPDSGTCDDASNATISAAETVTPTVRVGAEIDQAEVATNASLLQPRGNLTSAAPSEDQGFFGDASAAPLPAGRDAAAPRAARAQPMLQAAGTPRDAPQVVVPPPTPLPLKPESDAQAPESPHAPLAVIAVAAATSTLLLIVAAVLYSRFANKSDALRNPRRLEILGIVAAQPGVSPSDVATRMGVTRNAVMHHAYIMQEHGIIQIAVRSHQTFLLPVGAASEKALMLRSKAAVCAIEALRASPAGLTRAELASRMGAIAKRTRNHSIAKLVALGIVDQATRGVDEVLVLRDAHGAGQRSSSVAV